MQLGGGSLYVCFFAAVICFKLLEVAESKLPQEEVDALQEIATTMRAVYWKFDGDACRIETAGLTEKPPEASESRTDCECHFNNNTVCHVVTLVLKRLSLPGVLPPELVKLPYLRQIDFAYNCLNGTIPKEWASMKLTSISVLANRLSGEIPKELGNITTLTYLFLEANLFTGILPTELGYLTNMQTLVLSNNRLTGKLPETLAGLTNLTDLRLNDNNFNGTIPNWVQNYKQLTRLELHSSGLSGPIPSNISLLSNLIQLRISDLDGPDQEFPSLRNMTSLLRLVLRSCNIVGEIPTYVWSLKTLGLLDLSFNKLVGDLSSIAGNVHLKYVLLTRNRLSGNLPDSLLQDGNNVDVSYNNLTVQRPEDPNCQGHMSEYNLKFL